MPKIIDRLEGKRIFDISQFEKRLTDEYLGDLTNAQTAFIQSQYFPDDDNKISRTKLLNMSYAIPYKISSLFAEYVGNPLTEINIDLETSIMGYSWGGYAVMVVRKVDGKCIVDFISPDSYSTDSLGTEKIYTFYTRDEGTAFVTYILEQTYLLGVVTNRLFRRDTTVTTGDYSISGEEVALTTLPETTHLPETENLGIGMNPIVVVNNTKLDDYVYGTSDLKKVRSLISSLEIQAVNIQDQFLKHLKAKLALPVSKMPVDSKGFINVNQLQYIGLSPGDPTPSYIMNNNPLIERSFENMENIIVQIAAILSIPPEFFNIKTTGGAESANAKSIRLSAFLKKIEKIREKFAKGIEKLNAIFDKFGQKIQDKSIYWGSVFPTDTFQLANELSVAKDAKLISAKKAIMRYQDIREDEAEKELAIINEENAEVNLNTLPS